jgi:hypothetical protein
MQEQGTLLPPPQAPILAPGPNGPADVYRAFRAQRQELENQLESIEGRREELSEQLTNPMVQGADRKGIEQQIVDLDARIAVLNKAVADANMRVADAAGVPGATVEPPRPRDPGPPEEFFVLSGIFMVVVLLPLSIAFARRLWRRGAAAVSSLPGELAERLTRMEQAVDAIAVEVERIGEGQRYMTRQLGAGSAEPIAVKQRESAGEYRR